MLRRLWQRMRVPRLQLWRIFLEYLTHRMRQSPVISPGSSQHMTWYLYGHCDYAYQLVSAPAKPGHEPGRHAHREEGRRQLCRHLIVTGPPLLTPSFAPF